MSLDRLELSVDGGRVKIFVQIGHYDKTLIIGQVINHGDDDDHDDALGDDDDADQPLQQNPHHWILALITMTTMMMVMILMMTMILGILGDANAHNNVMI